MTRAIMIAAVMTVKNEEDIIEANILHLLDNGVNAVRISDHSSTDGTFDVICDLSQRFGNAIVGDINTDPLFHQARVMNELVADVAGQVDWVLPVDADEFVYATRGGTIRDALSACRGDVVVMRPYLHLDWNRRIIGGENRLSKVAFRWRPGAGLKVGNHGVTGMDDAVHTLQCLDLREIKFRSYEHFRSKVALNIATLGQFKPGDADHYRVMQGLTDQQMEAEWTEYIARPTVDDPIPSSHPI